MVRPEVTFAGVSFNGALSVWLSRIIIGLSVLYHRCLYFGILLTTNTKPIPIAVGKKQEIVGLMVASHNSPPPMTSDKPTTTGQTDCIALIRPYNQQIYSTAKKLKIQIIAAAKKAAYTCSLPFIEDCWTKASQASAKVPNVAPQEWPSSTMTILYSGLTPILNNSGAPTATATPKPVIPCKKLGNTHPNIKICNSSCFVIRWIPVRIASTALTSQVISYK